MKLKGQIMSVDTSAESVEVLVLQIVATGSSVHSGGRNHEVSMNLRLEAPRAVLKDYALGDFFEITVEQR
jgi:hypothetical protein